MTDLLATARMQLHREFDFDATAAIVPYYAALGISHLYLSPIGAAVPGSMHGYDVIDPARVNPELGGEAGLRRLVAEVRRHAMGIIVDIVPNHAAASVENPWWRDTLIHGEAGEYAHYFDIDWHAPMAEGKLWLPLLHDSLADAVASRKLCLDVGVANGEPSLNCQGTALPLSNATIVGLLTLAGKTGRADTPRAELLSLWRQISETPATRHRLEAGMTALNSNVSELRAVIDRQHYRPACWRDGNDVINYRRFFDISSLAGLAVEKDDVFDAVHALPLRLVGEGLIDGLRIDHVDGLSAPGVYLKKLRGEVAVVLSQRPSGTSGAVSIHAEKILAQDETLPADWPIEGTTGYEFMDIASAVFHNPDGALPLQQAWSSVSGRTDDFVGEERDARSLILRVNLKAEFRAVVRAWWALARHQRIEPDLTKDGLEAALASLLESMPVYRTYLENACTGGDRKILERAFAHASAVMDETAGLVRLRLWLLGPLPADETGRRLLQLARRRLEQTSAPLNAKSVEDTAFYRYGALLSRNEVGSNPGVFAHSVSDFHRFMQRRALDWPLALSATATHDHKRGEDTRARLAVISERPAWFIANATQWIEQWRSSRHERVADVAPGDIWNLLQTVFGAWPLNLQADDGVGMAEFFERLNAWQEKALREAKLRTSWSDPNVAYEGACKELLRAWLLEDAFSGLREELADAAHQLDVPGAVAGLSMMVLRLTAPGVPDLYQGTEFWDQSLVDPDNRRPVDFSARREALASSSERGELLRNYRNGEIKQWILARLLKFRRLHPALVLEGDYRPLAVTGDFAARVIAFARQWAGERCIVVVPRLCSDWLAGATQPSIPALQWANTNVQLDTNDAACTFRHVFIDHEEFSGSFIPLQRLLATWPVAVLVASSDCLESP